MTMLGQFDADVQAIEPELPLTMVWKGKSIPASRSIISDHQALQDAGIIQLYDLDLIVRLSAFAGLPILPVKNDEVDIVNEQNQTVAYRIDKIGHSQDGVCLNIGLVQLN